MKRVSAYKGILSTVLGSSVLLNLWGQYALTITIIIKKEDGSSLQKPNGKKPSNQNFEDWPLEEKRSVAFSLV
jgi:hypothetical protein